MTEGGGETKNCPNLRDVIYECPLTSVAHPGSEHFPCEGKNLSGCLISTSFVDQPQIGLEDQVGVGLVLVLQRAGGIVSHGGGSLGITIEIN